jgi:hypothetical protein
LEEDNHGPFDSSVLIFTQGKQIANQDNGYHGCNLSWVPLKCKSKALQLHELDNSILFYSFENDNEHSSLLKFHILLE